MNHLNHIEIQGEIFEEYANLQFCFHFENTGPAAISPRYLFALPKGAQISGLSVLDEDRILRRAAVVPLKKASQIWEEEGCALRLTGLGQDCYALEFTGLRPSSCQCIFVEVYAVLVRRENRIKLTLPLGLDGPFAQPSRGCTRRVSVCLRFPGGGVQILWPEQGLVQREDQGDILVEGTVDAYNDIALQWHTASGQNRAWLQDNGIAGVGVYRLYPLVQDVPVAAEIALWADVTGCPRRDWQNAVKQTLAAAVRALTGNAVVHVALPGGAGFPPVDRIVRGEEEVQELIDELREADLMSCSLEDGFAWLKNQAKLGQKPLLLTLGRSRAAFPEPPCGLCVLTVGTRKHHSLWERLVQDCHGRIGHVYPQCRDHQFLSALRSVLQGGSLPGELRAAGGGTCEIHRCDSMLFSEGDGGIWAAVSYSGAAPEAFWWHGEGRDPVLLSVQQVQRFETFRLSSLIYGACCAQELMRLLLYAGPSSHQAIRRQLAELGVKHGLVNSETAMVLPLSGHRTGAVEVVLPQYELSPGEPWPGGPTMFGERDRLARLSQQELEALKRLCAQWILTAQTEDGAIALPGVLNPAVRRQQTAFCAASLRRLDMQELSCVIKAAEQFAGEAVVQGVQTSPVSGSAAGGFSQGDKLLKQVLQTRDPITAAGLLMAVTEE